MAAPHVCILQTSFAKREDTVAFLKEKVPGVRVEFITDSTLLTDVRANGGPSQAVIDRMTLYAKAAEISGADLIVNSCSTVGEVADIYAKEVNVPVMKIDLPMAQEAVRLGTKIALIATLETTLGPSQRLIEKVGAEQGKKMECTQYLQNPAWDALQAGHPEEHNRILMESIRELDKMGYDAIVMAQVSMRALLPDQEGGPPPVPPRSPAPGRHPKRKKHTERGENTKQEHNKKKKKKKKKKKIARNWYLTCWWTTWSAGASPSCSDCAATPSSACWTPFPAARRSSTSAPGMRPLPPPRLTATPASPTRPPWSCATWAPA